MSIPVPPESYPAKRPNRVLRIIGIVVLSVVAFIAIIIGVAFYATSGVADAGNRFFERLRAGDAAGAYELTTPAFRSGTSAKDFADFIRSMRTEKFNAPSWNERRVSGTGENARGELQAKLSLTSGETRDVTLVLRKVDGEWRISSLDFMPIDATAQEPDDAALARMAHESNTIFSQSVAAGSMKAFWDHTGRRFKEDYSLESTQKSFAVFIDRRIDLKPIETLTPVIDKREMRNPTTLVVTGRYETRPSRVLFSQTYVAQGPDWKLLSYDISVKPADAGENAPR